MLPTEFNLLNNFCVSEMCAKNFVVRPMSVYCPKFATGNENVVYNFFSSNLIIKTSLIALYYCILVVLLVVRREPSLLAMHGSLNSFTDYFAC